MSEPRYHNKEWLENELKTKTGKQIAIDCNVAKSTISKWKHILNINIKPFYKNKKWLKEQIKIKTQTQIGKECNVGRHTIGKWRRIFGFTLPKPQYLNKEWLYNQYKVLHKSTNDIARELDVSASAIKRAINKFGFSINKYKGENSKSWRGGKIKNEAGYWIYTLNHHRTNYHGYVLEHILIIEKNIGRKLKDKEIIHHIDGNKFNNKLNNLYICNGHSHHQKVHHSIQLAAYKIYRLNKALQIKFNKEKGRYFII